MEKLKQLVNHLVIALCLLATSCGYVSDKPVENANVYHVDEFQTCKIDVSKLGEIFKADQKEQIKCLQENFVQFTKYVRSKNPGSVTEAELGIFVKRFFEGQSDAIVKGLSLIFQLNMLLLKDEADRISHTNISPLFQLLVEVNQEAVVLTNIIKMMDEEKSQQKFWEYRKKFNESTTRFAGAAIGVIDKSPGLAKKLNMREFILDMSKKIGDGQIDNESIDSFLFLKKVIIGGDEEVITTDELKEVITKLPKILGLVFDIYYVKSENFKSDMEEMRFYLLSVRNLYHSIKFNQGDFELLTSKQIVDLAKKLAPNLGVEKFQDSIEVLKERFIGGSRSNITLKDLDTAMIIVHDFFEKVYFVHNAYDDADYNKLLTQTGAIKAEQLPFKQLSGYDIFTNKPRLDQLHASFIDTAVNFRYFRAENGSAFYDTAVKRNKKGFIEVNIAKWLSYKLLKAYGHNDANKQMQLTMEEFARFLKDSQSLLEEFKLWSPNFETFSRNAVLLADLFQQQSNGDQKININEATEYIGMLLTAVDVSGKFSDQLTGLCDGGINADKDPVFEKNCYNANFYDLILNKLEYGKSLPRLANYYKTASKTETMDYLKGVEGFARDDDRAGVPVNRRDTTLIIGAMLNIETTFIRFDKNSDNIIDYKELSEAFFTYRASIISLAGLKKDQEKYAKGIFLYMASKMEIPKVGDWLNDVKFAAFDSCVQTDWCREGFMDKIEAKRLNIGKLLYYMVNQNSVAPKK